jgi:hypothetical protein
VIVEIGGLRLLTGPTFDPPGDHPVRNRVLIKTSGVWMRRKPLRSFKRVA